MAWGARRCRRSFIVPLYRSQFRVSRRYVPYPEPGGAPCPSRSSRRFARRPGPTNLTATTRTRRRGLTCHRSARRAHTVHRPEAIQLIPDAPAVPEAVLRALAVLVAVTAAPAAPRAVPRLLTVASVALTAVPPVPAALPPGLLAPASRTARIPGVLAGHAGSPIRVRKNRCRSGPNGADLRRTATSMRRQPSRACPAGAPCGPRRAGGGGGSSWRAAWSSWPGPYWRWCC
jgi:hypothetical protein